MLDVSDALAVFAETIVRSASAGSISRFSDFVGQDLNGAIGLLDDSTPLGLMNYAAAHCGLRCGKVLDFGCGSGLQKGLLESKGLRWTGLDYDGSVDPAALNRATTLDNIVVKYDGDRFPFPDASFDAVWSSQSLEHVHSPEVTFAEIARVLAPGGVLLGSTSFLEAYHARSTFCYSPYGFKLICDRHGLELARLFPSTDGLSLVFRRYFWIMGFDETEYDDWNKMMRGGGAFFEALRRRADATGDRRNLAEAMAQVCGQFWFIARMVKESSNPGGHAPFMHDELRTASPERPPERPLDRKVKPRAADRLKRFARRLRQKYLFHPMRAAIASSELFDRDWYLRTHADVASAGMDPIKHYIKYGAEEGRDPGPFFSTRGYLAANPDVDAAGVNPLFHYLQFGRKEGRRIQPPGRLTREP